MSITTADTERILARHEAGPDGLHELSVSSLANLAYADWTARAKGGIYFGAEPYVTAMMALTTIDDAYGADRGRDVVAYFLSNASSWRGPVARAVKAELKQRLGR